MPQSNEGSHAPECVRNSMGAWVCAPWCIFSPLYTLWKGKKR